MHKCGKLVPLPEMNSSQQDTPHYNTISATFRGDKGGDGESYVELPICIPGKEVVDGGM